MLFSGNQRNYEIAHFDKFRPAATRIARFISPSALNFMIISMPKPNSAEERRTHMVGLDTDARLQLLRKYGTNPYSALLLYGDFHAFPLDSGDGFVGYRNGRGMALVMGEPICAPEHYREAMQEFIAFCRDEKKTFFQICCGDIYKEAVRDLDLSVYNIGENFIFDASIWSPNGRQAKPVRWASNRALRSGVAVKEYDPCKQPDPALEAALETVCQSWIKKTNPFTAHLIDLAIFEQRACKRYFYAELGGAPVAMITCLPIHGRQGILFEDVIRDPSAPYGTIELITLTILDDLKPSGLKMATFGISPRLDTTGLTGTSGFFAKTTMWLANRMFGLPQLYHFRKKFHASHTEPLYAFKYPEGFGLADLVRIPSLF
jgi:phosphatidylglycerol lysyltransferase